MDYVFKVSVSSLEKPRVINVFPDSMFVGLKTLFNPNKREDFGAGISPVRFIQEGFCSGDGGLDTDRLVTSR